MYRTDCLARQTDYRV
uniref:Uncharacterized protein n=1 Tax=Lepeophtheirus salmonis TaxID=72036 RepID=A0A0K2UKU7_LEPSM